MKFGVVVFPGSNCDEDMVYVLRNIMKQEVEKLWHKEHSLKGCDFIVLREVFLMAIICAQELLHSFRPLCRR